MDKASLVDYLANLIVIDDYLDDRGVQHTWLNYEEDRAFKELEKVIVEEQKKADEARKSEQQRVSAEGGA